MLKSTYKPSANLASQPPLLPGWTEHKAPTGHTYYYNAETKESTYKRPGAAEPLAVALPIPLPIPQLQLSDPHVANAFMAQHNAVSLPSRRGDHSFGRGGRGGGEQRHNPQPVDKPRSKVAIPGCEPWILVYTKYGRRFAYNPAKNTSYWRIPDKLKAGILELDQARIREKAGGPENEKKDVESDKIEEAAGAQEGAEGGRDADFDSSEYEEVEVTDDEEAGGDDGDDDGNPHKRRRAEELDEEAGPVEFGEADIAYQLQAMDEGYDMDYEYDAGESGSRAEGDTGLSDEDASGLFKDLLNDANINPFSPWEKLIEEGKIFDDARYTALDTMKARKEVWEEWSRDRIKELKEQKAKAEKRDPRIPYMAFLQEHATPKLYWPEFKRKYKKEAPMKDPALSDKDREKWYRDYIGRLKLPQTNLKSDLMTLLRSLPLSKLNNKTLPSHLPPQILTDIRFVSVDTKIRDPLVEAYIQALEPPPEDGEATEEDETVRRAKEDRRRREKALQGRERAVAEEKERQRRRLEHGKAMLREEERELEKAMLVGKRGLQSQLMSTRDST